MSTIIWMMAAFGIGNVAVLLYIAALLRRIDARIATLERDSRREKPS